MRRLAGGRRDDIVAFSRFLSESRVIAQMLIELAAAL
jgi:hypothetical protein